MTLKFRFSSSSPGHWYLYVRCMPSFMVLTPDSGFLHCRRAFYQLSSNHILSAQSPGWLMCPAHTSSSFSVSRWVPSCSCRLLFTITPALSSSDHHGLWFDFGTRCHCWKRLGTSSALLVELSLALEVKLNPQFHELPFYLFLLTGLEPRASCVGGRHSTYQGMSLALIQRFKQRKRKLL